MIERVLHRMMREIVMAAAALAPAERRRLIRRRARGREDTFRLRASDYAIVSYGKSGRTWLNVMLSRFFQLRHNLPTHSLIYFDNLHSQNKAIPKILFTHDNYIRDYTGAGSTKVAFYDKPTILLVRHPADVSVSQFFQWQHRMPAHKKVLNEYPAHGADISVADFVLHADAGLPRAVRFLNEWAKELPRMKNVLIVRYEDMRRDPNREMQRMLNWMKQSPTESEISQSVEFAAFENMRKLEERPRSWLSGKRLAPGKKGDTNSYKVRRAKIGGYHDYFDDAQTRQIDDYVAANLDPVFGYGNDASPTTERKAS
ncbi:MAG: sulfotransferase [Rhodospirillaceae bacterium]|nr:MAG: sulfotransferase [Rhodospirillaceae bacterium]